MIKQTQKRSIAWTLVYSLILIGALIAILTSFLSYSFLSHRSKIQHEKKLEEHLSYLKDSLELPVWRMDRSAFEKISMSFVKNDVVGGIRILDEDGELLFETGADLDTPGLIKGEAYIRHRNENIGQVILGLTPSVYKQRNKELFIVNMFVAIMMIAGIAVSTRYIMKAFLREPLDDFIKRIQGIAAGEYQQTVKDYKQHEIESISNEFDRMVQQVNSRERSLINAKEALEHEVKERKSIQETLAKNERNYREIFNSTNEAIFIHDSESGNIIDVNQSVLDIFGFERSELINGSIAGLSSNTESYDLDNAVKLIQKANQEGPQTFEWLGKKKSGEEFWIEVVLKSARIGGEKRVLAVSRDISERKTAEDELQRWSHIFQHARWGVAVGEVKTNTFDQVNPAFAAMHGYSQEELVHTDIKNVFAHKFRSSLLDVIQKAHKKGHFIFEADHIKKDGTIFPVLHDVTTVKDKEGNPLYRIVNIQDLTKQKQEAAERFQLEKQLQQVQKMEAIGSLAGGIAHDFNNILGAVLGYAELVKEDLPPGSSSAEMQEQVIKAGIRAKKLIEQILLFSRQADQEPAPIQPHRTIKEVLKLLRSSIPTTIEIEQNNPPDLGSILADPTHIHQILMNLCTNSYHAMRETGGVLAVTLSKVEIDKDDITFTGLNMNPGVYLMIEVSDSGHGMDRKTLDKIFDPYFTTKPKEEGTGLGLSVVHGIVKSYDGHIKVYSEPGLGTKICVYFPRVSGQDDSPDGQIDVVLPSGNERILLVDDDKPILDMLKHSLEKLGYNVFSFSSSREAFDWFQSNSEGFDAVITDMTMPQMTGLELASRILKIKPETPVILCTGYSELITKEKARALGIKEFLLKPVLRKDLSEVIRRVFDHAS